MDIIKRIAVAVGTGLLVTACTTTGTPGLGSHAPLVGKQWVVQEIAGQPVIEASQASLTFGSDGRVFGNASCNRFFANYNTSGSNLTFSYSGLTKMACAPAQMAQEQRFLDVVNGVQSYRFDATGALVLVSRTGASLTAR